MPKSLIWVRYGSILTVFHLLHKDVQSPITGPAAVFSPVSVFGTLVKDQMSVVVHHLLAPLVYMFILCQNNVFVCKICIVMSPAFFFLLEIVLTALGHLCVDGTLEKVTDLGGEAWLMEGGHWERGLEGSLSFSPTLISLCFLLLWTVCSLPCTTPCHPALKQANMEWNLCTLWTKVNLSLSNFWVLGIVSWGWETKIVFIIFR